MEHKTKGTVTYLITRKVMCILKINPLTKTLIYNRVLCNPDRLCMLDLHSTAHSSLYLVKTELVIDNRQLSRELERLGRDLNILALTMDTLNWVTLLSIFVCDF